MPQNILLTGPPRSGKTTVIERVIERLEAQGLAVGGIVSPEIRTQGDRVGFEIVDVRSGETEVMAHVDLTSGPRVGKYRVDIAAVDRIADRALASLDGIDVVVIDEIAPMEVDSPVFDRSVRAALDSSTPVVAAIHQRSTAGFIGEVKERADVDLLEVSTERRDQMPQEIASRVVVFLGKGD